MFNDYNSGGNRYSKVLTIVLIVIVVIILILLGIWGYTTYKNMKANQELANAFDEPYTKVRNVKNTVQNEKELDNTELVAPVTVTEVDNTGNSANAVKTYKGFVMVGRIEIPKTKVNLPVLETPSAKALETSVAVLYGPGLNKVGNTTIVGHNYRNGMFFSNNAKIEIGDKIYITDTTGNKLTYIVYNTYVTTPEDAEYTQRDTNGAIEISLSTCTDDSSGRIIIWAKAE